MKITPIKNMALAQKADNSKVQLAFVESTDESTKFQVRALDNPTLEKWSPAKLYSYPDLFIFDKNGTVANENFTIQNSQNKYRYVPKNIKIVDPISFSYRFFKSSKNKLESSIIYNININIALPEEANETIVTILEEAIKKAKLSNSNIKINNDLIYREYLSSGDFFDLDIVITTDDSLLYLNELRTNCINNYTNLLVVSNNSVNKTFIDFNNIQGNTLNNNKSIFEYWIKQDNLDALLIENNSINLFMHIFQNSCDVTNVITNKLIDQQQEINVPNGYEVIELSSNVLYDKINKIVSRKDNIKNSDEKCDYDVFANKIYVYRDIYDFKSDPLLVTFDGKLKISACQNSYYNIDLKQDTIFDVDDKYSEIYINADNTISPEKKNEKSILIGTIKKQTSGTSIIDARIKGGGLKENLPDNYDLLDIGHILGRPYRKGGTLIITLPKRLENHKDLIEKEITQYMLAEDLPILIFE